MTLQRQQIEPFYFGSPERPLFGCLHQPSSASVHDLGLVICNPFGHEALSSHRSLRHFAGAATAIGIPALRFDFDGSGDSSGSDEDPDRLCAWIASIHQAVDALRQATGVTRVALLGVRLGALLAAIAATQRNDIAGVALVAPVVTGKSWLREMRALHGTLELPNPPEDSEALPEGAREVLGFFLSAQTVCDLTDLDLTQLEKSPAAHVLLLERDDLPAHPRLATHFSSLGAQVEQLVLPGYADMMQDPHKSQVPTEMVNSAIDWLCVQTKTSETKTSDKKKPFTSLAKELESSATSANVDIAVREHAVFLDAKRCLFGIVSEPVHNKLNAEKKAILLVNAGANHRVGPNRLHVKLARHWAARGYHVLRFDIAGVGDSLLHSGEAENVVYSKYASEDITKAVDYLKDMWNAKSCHIVGLCSGAYHAFKAALSGAAVDGIVLINPLTFNWNAESSLDISTSQVFSEAARYKKSMLQPEKWKRLLRGEADVQAVVQVIARRGAGIASRCARNAARHAHYPLRNDLGTQLETLARHNIQLHFVFAAGDPGLALLHDQGGPSVSRLIKMRQLVIENIEGPDHTFTPLWSHKRLITALDKGLG